MTLNPAVDPPAQNQKRRGVASRLGRTLQLLRRTLTLVPLAGPLACADGVRAGVDGPSDRATKVEEVSDAIAARFTNPERSGRFEAARRRLVSGALHPSRVYSDTSLWSVSPNSATHALWAHGSLTPAGYRFDVAERGVLADLGDTRHVITLRKLSDGEYQWTTGVDFAVGSITARDAAAMTDRLLMAGVDHDAAALRAGTRAALPRTSAVMAKLFRIDSFSLKPGPLGTTTVNLDVSIHTETLRQTAPHFAEYLAKYVEGSKYRFLVTDKSGAPYFQATGGDRRLSIVYRVRSDGLVSTLGPPRPMPDSLRLVSDLTMRVKMFDVGWKNLTTDFIISRGERSRSWLFVARTEPDWDLPLVTARLIRSSLRRPFEGAGSTFEIAVIDSAGGQTILARRARLDVKESAIMRFLSSLVARIFDDLDVAVEQEEAAFVRELMGAFQQDARAILVR
jgi:hypothetical protein